MARKDSGGSGKMTIQRRKAETLKKMSKEADYYASMGGRGPKKGSKAYNDRIAYLKAGMKAAKDQSTAQRAEAKAEKAAVKRRPAAKKKSAPRKSAGGRAPRRSGAY